LSDTAILNRFALLKCGIMAIIKTSNATAAIAVITKIIFNASPAPLRCMPIKTR